MKNTEEVVQRIASHYVGKDCVQIMVPYRTSLAIINSDGIVYSHRDGSHISTNQYMSDERRKQFPYSNIPTHYSRDGFSGRINHTNQLLNFEEPYIGIGDNRIFESFAIKDNNDALIINTILRGNLRKVYANREEVEEMFNSQSNGEEKKYIVYLDDDSIDVGIKRPLPSEERICASISSQLAKNMGELRSCVDENVSSAIGWNLSEPPLFLDFVEQSIPRLDGMKFNYPVKGGKAIILKSKGDDMTLQYHGVNFISPDNYRVDIIDLPINKYTLEQLKHLSQTISKPKEPRIPLKLNPGISRGDIAEAKRMVLTLKRN